MIKTDIGHGRGWLDAPAAASLARIDADMRDAFGRVADVNEAGRSAKQADANYAAWIAYSTRKGPKAPYALPASKSVHVPGMAADSDDWYNATAASIWRDHGWRQTALYPNNPKKNEPWHGEYFLNLDNHRHDPAPAGAATGGTLPHLPEDEMRIIKDQVGTYWLVKPNELRGIDGPQHLELLRRALTSKSTPGAKVPTEDLFNAREIDILKTYFK